MLLILCSPWFIDSQYTIVIHIRWTIIPIVICSLNDPWFLGVFHMMLCNVLVLSHRRRRVVVYKWNLMLVLSELLSLLRRRWPSYEHTLSRREAIHRVNILSVRDVSTLFLDLFRGILQNHVTIRVADGDLHWKITSIVVIAVVGILVCQLLWTYWRRLLYKLTNIYWFNIYNILR